MLAVSHFREWVIDNRNGSMLLPVDGAAARGLGENPSAMTLPGVMATSLGLMPPLGKPPNAFVDASAMVSNWHMLGPGAILETAGTAGLAMLTRSLGAQG